MVKVKMVSVRTMSGKGWTIRLKDGSGIWYDGKQIQITESETNIRYTFSLYTLDYMYQYEEEVKGDPTKPEKKPERKCRSCKFDMSDDRTTHRTEECPDYLDGKISNGCDKYEREIQHES